jgi:hypothetical protein
MVIIIISIGNGLFAATVTMPFAATKYWLSTSSHCSALSGFCTAAPVSDATCGATAITSTIVSADAADIATSCQKQQN